jgi:hypothetical protein
MSFLTRQLLLALLVPSGSAGPSAEIEVTLVVGQVHVPLGVEHHFADRVRELPPPGRLSVDDPHDRKHGAVTYCYGFDAGRGFGQLELYDSDFGMHTVRVLHAANRNSLCPQLGSAPYFVVEGETYSLADRKWSAPPGFQSDRNGDAETFTLEWTYTDASRPHMWVRAFPDASK